MRVPQPAHGQGDAALEEVVLEVAEVVLLDDVAGGEASENSLEDDEHGRWPVQTGRHSVGHLQSSKAALYQQTKCFDIHIMLYICMYNCISISITIGAVIHSSMALRFMSTSSLVTSGIFFFLFLLLLLWQVMSCLLWICST